MSAASDLEHSRKKTPTTPCECGSNEFSIRKDITGEASGYRYAYQCGGCGKSRSHGIKTQDAITMNGGVEPLLWDRDLEQHGQGPLWWEKYNAYLATEEWAERRRRVIDRCGGTCEGCRNRPVEHVHHLTYDHVGNELLFELVGLCLRCHRVAHGGKTALGKL